MFLNKPRNTIIGGSCIAALIFFSRYYQSDMPSESYHIVYDTLFSPRAQELLALQFQESYDVKKIFQEQLLTATPAVQAISFRRNADGYQDIIMHAKKPLMLVNGDYVITEDQDFIAQWWYCSEQVALLDRVYIHGAPDNVIDGAECLRMIRDLPAAVRQEYQISWHSKHAIYFKKKDTESVHILLGHVHTPDILTVVDKLCEQTVFGAPTKKTWVADARFHQQIILYEQKEGVRYG